MDRMIFLLRRTAVLDLSRISKLRHPEHPVILSNRTSRPFCRRTHGLLDVHPDSERIVYSAAGFDHSCGMTPSRISAAPWAGRSPRLPVSLALALAVVQAASLLTSPAAAAAAAAALLPPPAGPNARPIFDGKTLAGWEGNPRLWRVEGRAITGGSLTETVRENDFIASTRDYTNFIVFCCVESDSCAV